MGVITPACGRRARVVACAVALALPLGCARLPGAPGPLHKEAGSAVRLEPEPPEAVVRAAATPRALARGDLDGDGRSEWVVGRPARGGIEVRDDSGRLRFAREDVDVRQVALIEANGDAAERIVHTNRQGAFVVRDAQGRTLRRFETGAAARYFAVVAWPEPAAPPLLVQRCEQAVELWDLGGRRRARLSAGVWNESEPLEAVAFAPTAGARPWLGVLDVFEADGLAVLSVFDAQGRLVVDDVLWGACRRLEAERGEGDAAQALRVGCGGHAWRYTAGSVTAPAPVRSLAAVRREGDAFGPLRFGDSESELRRRQRLLPGHRCRGARCQTSLVRIGSHDFVLAPQLEGGRLAGVLLVDLPTPEADYRGRTRAGWRDLVRRVEAQEGAPRSRTGFPAAAAVRAADLRDGWRTVVTHRWRGREREVELGVLTVDGHGPLQFASYALISPAVAATDALPAVPAP